MPVKKTPETTARDETLAEAMAKVLGEIQDPPLDKQNTHFRSKYSSLPAVLKVVRPVLAKHGVWLDQRFEYKDGELLLVTELQLGEQRKGSVYPIKPQKEDPQGYASAVTYARRIALTAMLSICGDEDDDANVASGKGQTRADTRPAARKPSPGKPPAKQPKGSARATVNTKRGKCVECGEIVEPKDGLARTDDAGNERVIHADCYDKVKSKPKTTLVECEGCGKKAVEPSIGACNACGMMVGDEPPEEAA